VAISRKYYGWVQAGTLGFLIISAIIAAMYLAFIFSLSKVTTAIMHAAGPFAYRRRAFSSTGGAIAGFVTLVELRLAPPAIAMTIDA
jgi:ethanolamine permease